MSKTIIVEGNSNDKDNLRVLMVKGERGDVSKEQLDNVIKQIKIVDIKTNSLASGNPLSASSVEEMTDTTKIYVNTSDGYWYSYDGTDWVKADVYQSTVLGKNSVNYSNLSLDLQNSIKVKTDYVYGNYDDLLTDAKFSLGTQEGNGFYHITKNKPVDYDGYVTKFYLSIRTTGHSGTLKLERLKYENNILTVLGEDTNIYNVSYGNNVVVLRQPFQINEGEFLGFTITPTTVTPSGYCNVNCLNDSNRPYPYGLICVQYSNGKTLKNENLVPVFDFAMQSTFDNEDLEQWFYGKSWVAYGDSITAGYGLPNHSNLEMDDRNNNVETYVKIVAEKYNMVFHNNGTSGRGYSNGDAENYKAYKLIENHHVEGADIVTVAFGTNDWGTLTSENNVEFGNVSDSSSGTSFCSYVKKAFDNLVTYYPNSVIIIMTPIPRPNLANNNLAGHNLVDYAEAIKTIAKYYGFYIMDCLSIARSNVTSSTWRGTYMIDSVHMTEIYHTKYYAPMVEEQFKIAKIDNKN